MRSAWLPLFLIGCAVHGPATPPPAPEPTQVTVLFVADLHGQTDPHPELFWGPGGDRIEVAGGFARLGAAVAQIRAEQEGAVLFIDGGDTFQGSGLAALSEGEALVEPLRALGFDLGLPGNWEVAYGPEVMKARIAALDHPVIASNIRDEATGERLYPPSWVGEVAGVRVGVVGYTDPDVPIRQPPAYSTGLRYDGPDELQEEVHRLRDEEAADVVLLLSHIGLSKAVALAGELSGVDIHLSSDTHERTYSPVEVGSTWVVEPGAFGSFLGRLDLWVLDGEVVDRRWELIELTEAWPEDPAIAAVVQEARDPYAEALDERVGATDETLARYAVVETSLDAVLADALREVSGTEIALSNGFRFGTPLLPGPITVEDLWSFYPVVTPLKRGRVTGRQLREFWERELNHVFAEDATERFGGWVPRPSGMRLTFEARAPAGQRVRSIEVNGEPLDEERLYTLTACEREGEPMHTLCRIPHAQDVEILEVDAHDAVRAYLQRHGPLQRTEEGRARALDLPPILRSQHTF